MTQLIEPDGATTIYGYDKADRKTSIQYPNSTGMLITYDKAGHVHTSIGGVMNAQGQITTTYSSFTYHYINGTSQTALVQEVDELDPVGHTVTSSRTYSYNALNRLKDASVSISGQGQVNDFSYGYDPAGNRTSSSVLATGISYTYQYNAANELTSKTRVGGSTTSYSYDGNGNLTGSTQGGLSYGYNSKNQTTSIGSDSYTYSGPDQRDRVGVNSNTFIYSGLGLSSKTDSSNNSTYYVRCSCGLLNHELTPDGKKYYYLFDGLGSIVGLTNAAGNEINAYDYDPYGNMLNQTEGATNPWKFAGGYLDSSTGLYKFGVRYYDPTLGRWTQQDPVGGSLGDLNAANRYVYAGDDPVNEVDPSGNLGFSIIWAGPYPIGIAINLTSGDLASISTPIGGFIAGLIGAGVSALVNQIFPGFGWAGGLITAFIVANAVAIGKACPGGASVIYLFGTTEPFYVCM